MEGVLGKTLSPTAIAKASICLRFHYLERKGNHALKLPASDGQEESREKGIEFEKTIVGALKGVERPEWDGKDLSAGFRATLGLMESGAEWIHGGVLIGKEMAGIPDLLRKIRGKSRFGKFTYIPVEIKGHKAAQKKDKIQVSAYAELLEEVLGQPCERALLLLGKADPAEVDFKKLAPEIQRLRTEMRAAVDGKMEIEPYWCSACPNCAWLAVCKVEWKARDHISLLPNGGKPTVEKLYAAGIKSVKALASANPAEVAKKSKLSAAVTLRLWQHAKARETARPLQIKKPVFPTGIPIVFYDIETFGGTTFLHGVIRIHQSVREEHFFFADSLEDAGKAWKDFLNFIAKDKDSIIYCWADYESGLAKDSFKRFGGSRQAYEALMDRMVDQRTWVKDHFAFPTRSYSIKEVAPVFEFHWKAADAGGLNCEAWYGEWLETGEKALKEKILDYNRDDVLAMEVIFNELRKMEA